MNSPKRKKQDVRPSPTRGSASAENDLFTKAMLEEINAYISDTSSIDDNDSDDDVEHILAVANDDSVLGNNSDEEDSDEEVTSHGEQPTQKKIIKYANRKIKRQREILKKAKEEHMEIISVFKNSVSSAEFKTLYADETKLLHDLHLYCKGENGCTPNNSTGNSFVCNKRKELGCKGGFTKRKVLNIDTGKYEFYIKSITNHTCSKFKQGRAPNFPIKADAILPYIKYVTIKQPRVSIPLLLNVLQGVLGDLFSEDNRHGSGAKAYGYESVSNAREKLRVKYCGKDDHEDIHKLPI